MVASRRPRSKRPVVCLFGAWQPAMRTVMEEFLKEEMGLGVEHGFAHSPAVILAMVTRLDHRQVIGFARASAGGAPVVAVLPGGDLWLAERAIAAGAHAVQPLDEPFTKLRGSVSRFLHRPGPA